MGNTLGSKKTTKIMKINGETIKLKTPVQAGEVVKDYPGHVLLESESVKHFGIRAKPLESGHELKPKRLYFLVELPRFDQQNAPRRVRSGINMSAKDRLESMMLARRSASDLSIMKPTSIVIDESRNEGGEQNKAVRMKMRLPKAELAKLMKESKDEAEAAEKIMKLCRANKAANGGGSGASIDGSLSLPHQQLHWKSAHERVVKNDGFKTREKRVGFMAVMEREIQLAVG